MRKNVIMFQRLNISNRIDPRRCNKHRSASRLLTFCIYFKGRVNRDVSAKTQHDYSADKPLPFVLRVSAYIRQVIPCVAILYMS